LISRFFKRYPDYIDRAFLSVKGGLKVVDLKTAKIGPDSSPDGLRRSVTSILEALDGAKKLDLFECARVDPNVPIEEAVATMKDFVNEGLFDYIGLSETSAQTLAKASKVHPIAAVEIEVSLWSYEEETKKGKRTCFHTQHLSDYDT
jgi:pyridoxine 4-dehydrogenase